MLHKLKQVWSWKTVIKLIKWLPASLLRFAVPPRATTASGQQTIGIKPSNEQIFKRFLYSLKYWQCFGSTQVPSALKKVGPHFSFAFKSSDANDRIEYKIKINTARFAIKWTFTMSRFLATATIEIMCASHSSEIVVKLVLTSIRRRQVHTWWHFDFCCSGNLTTGILLTFIIAFELKGSIFWLSTCIMQTNDLIHILTTLLPFNDKLVSDFLFFELNFYKLSKRFFNDKNCWNLRCALHFEGLWE